MSKLPNLSPPITVVGLVAVALLATAISGNGNPKPGCDALARPQAVMQRCIKRGQYIGDDKCFPFSPEQRFRGILITGFERAEFHPGANAYAEALRQEPEFWLEASHASSFDIRSDVAKCTHLCAFALDFIGRKSLCQAGYGHLGGYPHEIMAVRLVNSNQISLTSD